MRPHEPLPSSTPTDAGTLRLLAAAKQQRLLLCVGAGLSITAGLPSGTDLGRKLDQRFRRSLDGYAPPDKPGNLLAVADAAASILEGPGVLENEVLELGPFTSAMPNYAHEVAALLLAEGAVTVLSWNWDTCIERAEDGAAVRTACTEEQIASVVAPQLLKVHGCADTRGSLLVTTGQLSAPPKWADDAFRDRINASETVFVGIGDVADYAQVRIGQLLERVDRNGIRVVAPNVDTEWNDNQWSSVVPDLPLSHRVDKTADAFFDDLGRAWVGQLQANLDELTAGLGTETTSGVDSVMTAFGSLKAAPAIRWVRRATLRCLSGESAVDSGATSSTMLALAVLAKKSKTTVKFVSPARLRIGLRPLEVLILGSPTPSGTVQVEALRRAQKLASDGSSESMYDFVVGGTMLGTFESTDLMNVDVLAGQGPADDIYDGQMNVQTRFVEATTLLKELV